MYATANESAFGTKRTCRDDLLFVRFRGKVDIGWRLPSDLKVRALVVPRGVIASQQPIRPPVDAHLNVTPYGENATPYGEMNVRALTKRARPFSITSVQVRRSR